MVAVVLAVDRMLPAGSEAIMQQVANAMDKRKRNIKLELV